MARAKQPAARPAVRKPSPKKGAGAKAPAPAVSDDAQAHLDVFIDRFTPEIASLARATLRHMRKRLPGAVSLVYDNYNALVIGFGPGEKVGNTPLSVALYPRWINLFFLQGAALPDPHRRLKGSGAIVRSIRIEKAEQLKDPEIDALISTAVMHVGWTLDRKAKNRLVIRMISPRQRPRRV